MSPIRKLRSRGARPERMGRRRRKSRYRADADTCMHYIRACVVLVPAADAGRGVKGQRARLADPAAHARKHANAARKHANAARKHTRAARRGEPEARSGVFPTRRAAACLRVCVRDRRCSAQVEPKPDAALPNQAPTTRTECLPLTHPTRACRAGQCRAVQRDAVPCRAVQSRPVQSSAMQSSPVQSSPVQ